MSGAGEVERLPYVLGVGSQGCADDYKSALLSLTPGLHGRAGPNLCVQHLPLMTPVQIHLYLCGDFHRHNALSSFLPLPYPLQKTLYPNLQTKS